jgi:hypothetical protein
MAKFDLGRTVATPGVLAAVPQDQLIPLVFRHAEGDWGDLDPEDAAANDQALIDGDRLLSAYTVDGTKVWIITEWDRSVTTILLPEEY